MMAAELNTPEAIVLTMAVDLGYKAAVPCQRLHAAPEPIAASEVFNGRLLLFAQIRQALSITH